MGLTLSSTGLELLKSQDQNPKTSEGTVKVALLGNPNTGKSTVFNALTGLKQHTGNWPGKTVEVATGRFSFDGKEFLLVDLPGTYSIFADSPEEEIARDFLLFSKPDVTVVVVDAACLERNLQLLLQVIEISPRTVLCVNLMDEAEKIGTAPDLQKLQELLNIPVVGTAARSGRGIEALKASITNAALKTEDDSPFSPTYSEKLEEEIGMKVSLFEQTPLDPRTKRWIALRLLDGDATLLDKLNRFLPDALSPSLVDNLARVARAERDADDIREEIVSSIYREAERIAKLVAKERQLPPSKFTADKLITSKALGIPIMLILLALVFWLTIVGANYPSQLLFAGFSFLETKLYTVLGTLALPHWLADLLTYGVFRTLSWVVAVMLPPMAIFFPLFTLLEDWGFLPRIAFNLDGLFRKAGSHGKQSLTMCMGFGCNAAGVVATRIIDSPRERLIAALTNNFVPCNGRFPTLILMITLFFTGSGRFSSLPGALLLLVVIVASVFTTLLVSKLLSKTILRGIPSAFSLELPPYRTPQLTKVLLRSLLDRTAFVLARAVLVAAPAGAVIWILANTTFGSSSLLQMLVSFLAPLGRLMGLDGAILTGFVLGFPANEIVLPVTYMAYLSGGTLVEMESLAATRALLVANGWSVKTALCLMIFSLNHFPCGTTLLTIKKETGSWKWTALAFIIPTLVGIVGCILVAQIYNFFSFLLL